MDDLHTGPLRALQGLLDVVEEDQDSGSSAAEASRVITLSWWSASSATVTIHP